MICKCGNETGNPLRRRCDVCKRQSEEGLISEFAAGFAEADVEANPHIYGTHRQGNWDRPIMDDPPTSTKWSADRERMKETLNEIYERMKQERERFAHQIFDDMFFTFRQPPPPPPKQPWPRPTISYNFDKQSWRVKDTVTEGWVDVPLEMLEARLGRHITAPHLVTHRSDIEACAKRLLILLIYGCPQRLEAKYAGYPERYRETFCKGWD